MREDITTLLQEANEGSKDALSALWSAVNDELRALARRHMEREFGRNLPGITLQPTALLNETYLRLIKQRTKYDGRGHFFAIATRVLIRVLRDYERQRGASKRGGGWLRVPLDQESECGTFVLDDNSRGMPVDELIAALERLEALDARMADVVKLRVFWGFTIADTAEAMAVGHATIERDWEFARVWLNKELSGASQ